MDKHASSGRLPVSGKKRNRKTRTRTGIQGSEYKTRTGIQGSQTLASTIRAAFNLAGCNAQLRQRGPMARGYIKWRDRKLCSQRSLSGAIAGRL